MADSQEHTVRISNELGIGMLALALLFDALQGFITFLPIPGLIIVNIFIAFIAYITFGVWFTFHRVNYFTGKKAALKLLAVFGTLVIEIIPLLNALPTIIGGVAIMLSATRIEDTLGNEKELTKRKEKQEKDLAGATSDTERSKILARQAVERRNMVNATVSGTEYEEPGEDDVRTEQKDPKAQQELEARQQRIRRSVDELQPYTRAWRDARQTQLAGEEDATRRTKLRTEEATKQLREREARFAAARERLEENENA